MCLSSFLVQWPPEFMLCKMNGRKQMETHDSESFSMVLVCRQIYPHFIGWDKSHEHPQHHWCRKIQSAYYNVTIKSYSKGSGHIILILSGHKTWGQQCILPKNLFFCLFFTSVSHGKYSYSYTGHLKVWSNYDLWGLIYITFEFVPLYWEKCEFKDKLFPLIHPACEWCSRDRLTSINTPIQKGMKRWYIGCLWFIVILKFCEQVLPSLFIPGVRHISLLVWNSLPGSRSPFYCALWLLTLLSGSFFLYHYIP